jgi:DNA-binding MarR family transcriptional regulator
MGGYYIVKSLHNPRSAKGTSAALERLFELVVLLSDGMESGLQKQGLTRARAEVVWRLQREEALTQRELSDRLRCTPRNVTGLVDALEAAGLVARRPHPTDRRATLVTLTKRGSTVAAQWQAEYQKLAAALFGDLSQAEIGSFLATLDRLLERLPASSLS